MALALTWFCVPENFTLKAGQHTYSFIRTYGTSINFPLSNRHVAFKQYFIPPSRYRYWRMKRIISSTYFISVLGLAGTQPAFGAAHLPVLAAASTGQSAWYASKERADSKKGETAFITTGGGKSTLPIDTAVAPHKRLLRTCRITREPAGEGRRAQSHRISWLGREGQYHEKLGCPRRFQLQDAEHS